MGNAAKKIAIEPEVIVDKKPIRLINEIKSMGEFKTDRKGISGLLKSLNPLEFASETVAQICHYRHQIKILETEQMRITKEADIRHHQIDAALQACLKTIEERRIAIEASLKVVTKELEHSHVEREKIVACITNCTMQMSDKDFSTEDRQLAHTTIALLTETLKDMGKQSSTNLALIATNTQKALEAIPQTSALLTFSE